MDLCWERISSRMGKRGLCWDWGFGEVKGGFMLRKGDWEGGFVLEGEREFLLGRG